MKIGVFDSGIGGKAIANKLEVDYPDAEVLYVDDHLHVPYGSRGNDEIIQLTNAAIQPLLTAKCDVIVLACNTATAAAIEHLRDAYPDTPFVGLEPMVGPAVSLTTSGIIAMCATPFTLGSSRYNTLKDRFATHVTILEPDCTQWASMIEHDEVEDQTIADVVNNLCDRGADVIVLGCTHYHWIKERIIELANNRAIVIDPSDAVSQRVGSILHPDDESR